MISAFMPLSFGLPALLLNSYILSLPPLLLIPSPTYALFQINNPPARGYYPDYLNLFPCGGNDDPTARTPFPITGGSIQLTMDQHRADVQVLLGLGNDPGENFDTVIVGIFEEVGMGGFCVGGVVIPQDLGIEEGMNATIQVVSSGDGDEGGGLYNCADITLSSTALSGPCVNDTGVTAVEYGGSYKYANGTDGDYTPSPTEGVIAAPTKKGAARKAELGCWALLVGAMMASLLL